MDDYLSDRIEAIKDSCLYNHDDLRAALHVQLDEFLINNIPNYEEA